MAVANTSILRLHRTDKTNRHLLVQVVKVGNKALDLKLIGTEHEHLYHAQIEESKLKSLQAISFSGDLTQWKAILQYALLHQKPNGQIPDYLQGLETVATISGKTLTITIRKNIDGITQRLSDIKLQQDDEKEEIDAFDWVDSAAATADSTRTELETLQTSIDEQREQVTSLNKQLDDLVKAKKEHEEELLAKFTALLNAKKLKIRDQQRLLAGTQIDPAAASALDAGGSRQSAKSKKGKRKAHTEDDEEMGDDEDNENGEDEHPQETPPGSDDEATEDEGNLDGPGASVRSQKSQHDMEIDEPDEVPSRRELPSRSEGLRPAAHIPPQIGDDDEETDDEL